MTSGNVMADTVIERRLDNGLTVLVVQDPSASLVSVRTYVRAGSIDEDPLLGSGLSHYLEHIVAGGRTAARSEDDYKDMISRMGGAYNAYTTTDHTSYYINTFPEKVDDAIEILNEWMFSCAFDEREFAREKEVITREIEKNNAHVGRQFYQLASDNFFKFHPLKYPVIGYLDRFLAVSRDDLLKYYRDFYVASNMVLVIGGNVDANAVLETVEATFAKAPRLPVPKRNKFDEAIPFASREVLAEGDTQVSHISLRFSTVDLFSDDLYPLDLLEFILGNGEQSLLYKRLVDDKKLAYSVSASSYTPSVTTGYFDISAQIDIKNKDAFITEVLAIVDMIKDGDIDMDRLERAKRQKISDDVFSVSNIDDKVSRVGAGMIYGFSKDFFTRYVAQFKAVDAADVFRVANEYLDADRIVVSVLTPKGTENKVETTISKEQIVPELKTLPNGMRVLLYENGSMPKAQAKLYILSGQRVETAETAGIGSVLADLLGRGSQKYDKDRIQQEIEDRGASLFGSMGRHTIMLQLDALSDDFSDLFSLFSHVALSARFNEDELSESRRQHLKSIRTRQDDWFTYASYHFKKRFFKDHPYALPMNGEVESIESLTVSDIETHYQRLLTPENMVLTVYGDFDEDEIMAQVESSFARLEAADDAYNVTAELDRKKNGEASEARETIAQDVAVVFLGYDGTRHDNRADHLKLSLLDAVLSGASYPSGRYHNIMREEGLVYMVHANNYVGIEDGFFYAYALTYPDKIDTVKEIFLREIDDVKAGNISDEAFEKAIAELKFYYKDRISTTEALSVVTATDLFYGHGHDAYLKMDAQIDALTKADAVEMAKKYLNHPQFLILTPEDKD